MGSVDRYARARSHILLIMPDGPRHASHLIAFDTVSSPFRRGFVIAREKKFEQ